MLSGNGINCGLYLKANAFSSCIFTKDIDKIYLPVGTGKESPLRGAKAKPLSRHPMVI